MSVSVFADLGPPHAPVFLVKGRQCGMTTYAKLVEQTQREIGVLPARGVSQAHWRKIRREQNKRYMDCVLETLNTGQGFMRLRWDENSNRVKVGRIDARQTQTT